MSKIYKCICDDGGVCVVDNSSTKLLCGIKGVLDIYNVKIIDKKVICNNCNGVVYENKDGSKE